MSVAPHIDPDDPRPTDVQDVVRVLMGVGLVVAGAAHLTWARSAFLAQVPGWVPVDADLVVVLSGVVEIALGASLALLARHRVALGWVTAAFFVAVFPGNVSQFVDGTLRSGSTRTWPARCASCSSRSSWSWPCGRRVPGPRGEPVENPSGEAPVVRDPARGAAGTGESARCDGDHEGHWRRSPRTHSRRSCCRAAGKALPPTGRAADVAWATDLSGENGGVGSAGLQRRIDDLGQRVPHDGSRSPRGSPRQCSVNTTMVTSRSGLCPVWDVYPDAHRRGAASPAGR